MIGAPPMVASGGSMALPRRIGMIASSSNTALEPTTSEVTASLQRDLFTIHYSRVVVKVISLDPVSVAQFTRAVVA
jgi:maleate cis-trans isomerase